MASFQDRAQHTIAQLDKEVSCLCVSSTGLGVCGTFTTSRKSPYI